MSLVIGGEAHAAASTHTKVIDLFSEDLTGVIHFVLSVELAEMMQKLRMALNTVIKNRLVWPPPRGAPFLEAVSYRLRCMQPAIDSWMVTLFHHAVTSTFACPPSR
ncbi:unnamed protein product [Prorocentrum cordatum]|uniref:Uncharacterized protein n=1 Tax=Prorocentrum cordatum TaxID=2364126 RepID=A0ABN9XZP0_9DINO|nr:unnamed protein product [Polarella glacialis]